MNSGHVFMHYFFLKIILRDSKHLKYYSTYGCLHSAVHEEKIWQLTLSKLATFSSSVTHIDSFIKYHSSHHSAFTFHKLIHIHTRHQITFNAWVSYWREAQVGHIKTKKIAVISYTAYLAPFGCSP